MADILCIGDLLIDFVPTVTGTGLVDAPAFTKAPGGAAANVAVGLARLGVKSAFMGKVGDDPVRPFPGRHARAPRASTSARCASTTRPAPPSPSSRCAPTASASSCSTATPAPTCCSCPRRSTGRRSRRPRCCTSTRSACRPEPARSATPLRDRDGAGRRPPGLLRRQPAPAALARRRGRAGRHPRRPWPRPDRQAQRR